MVNNELNVDRLSNLPNPVLEIILSLLPFREAARTSVLAKSWVNVWRNTQNLDFDEAFFVRTPLQYSINEKRKLRNEFARFVNQWLKQYKGPDAQSFRLVCSQPIEYLRLIRKYVQFAVDHKVKHLTLDFADSSWKEGHTKRPLNSTFVEVPLYEQHKSLESLKLSSCFLNSTQFEEFPVLKLLELGWMAYSGTYLDTLLSKCPMLEELTLTNVSNLRNIEIDEPNMKTLVIEKCEGVEIVYIDAKSMKSFKYVGEFIEFQFVGVNSLVNADFDFGVERDYDQGYGYPLYYNLSSIGIIQHLTVCSYFLQVISGAVDPLLPVPILPNVQSLTLKTVLHRNVFYGIIFFLNHCPSLEGIAFQFGEGRIFQEYEAPYSYKEHPFYARSNQRVTPYDCMSKKLKIVIFYGCKGERNELLVMKYFLKYGAVLERMFVSVSRDMESTLHRISQSLMHCERASPNVKVIPHIS